VTTSPYLTETPESLCYTYPAGTFVAVFRGRNGSRNIRGMKERLLGEAKRVGRVRVLVVIESHATLGERGRKEIAAMLREAEPYVSGWANVIDGHGLWASTARTIAAGVRLFSKTSFALRNFASAEDAAGWLSEHTRQTFPEDFGTRLVAARQALAAPGSPQPSRD
jgi:hypothetical protein